MMTVHAGTNCPQGGDSGHGGRTVFRIFNDGATDLRARIDDGNEQDVNSVEVVLGGDAEAACFADALEFAARTIRGQLGLPHGGGGEEEIP